MRTTTPAIVDNYSIDIIHKLSIQLKRKNKHLYDQNKAQETHAGHCKACHSFLFPK